MSDDWQKDDELIRWCVRRIKKIENLRIPPYDLPADSFIEKLVIDILSKSKIKERRSSAMSDENILKAQLIIKRISGYLKNNVIDDYKDVVELSCGDEFCDKYWGNGYNCGKMQLAKELLQILDTSDKLPIKAITGGEDEKR